MFKVPTGPPLQTCIRRTLLYNIRDTYWIIYGSDISLVIYKLLRKNNP